MGHLAEVEGRMDADQYMAILKEHMLPSLEESGISEEEVIFQQDNNFKHISKKAKKCEVCQKLIESMPRGLEAVIKAKGGHAKY